MKQVTPGSTVVVATHIPTYSREARRKEWGKESTMKVMNNRSHLYELLKPYNAHIIGKLPGLVTELQADMPFTSLTEVKSIGITNV